MRKNIIFRGWNGQRWLYGNLSDDKEFDGEFELDKQVKIMPKHVEEWQVDGVMMGIDYFVVNEDSVGECTGLATPTGDLIYEGDIINIPDYRPQFCEVRFNQGVFVTYYREWGLDFPLKDFVKGHKDKDITWRVVGNTFENPYIDGHYVLGK